MGLNTLHISKDYINEVNCIDAEDGLTCAPKKDSIQPADPGSLISVFVDCVNYFCILCFPKCAREDSDPCVGRSEYSLSADVQRQVF